MKLKLDHKINLTTILQLPQVSARNCRALVLALVILIFTVDVQASNHEMTIRVIENDDFSSVTELSLPPRSSREATRFETIKLGETDADKQEGHDDREDSNVDAPEEHDQEDEKDEEIEKDDRDEDPELDKPEDIELPDIELPEIEDELEMPDPIDGIHDSEPHPEEAEEEAEPVEPAEPTEPTEPKL